MEIELVDCKYCSTSPEYNCDYGDYFDTCYVCCPTCGQLTDTFAYGTPAKEQWNYNNGDKVDGI